MTFSATKHKISTDADGESTIVLKVPLTDLAAVTALNLLPKVVLKVGVVAAELAPESA